MGFGKDGRGVIMYDAHTGRALGTLASNAASTIDTGPATTMEENFRIIKIDYFVTWTGYTSGEGPILVGLCSAELTAAEIAETFVYADSPQSAVGLERASRAVFPIAMLDSASASDHAQGTKTIRWTFGDPDGWMWFAYNLSAGALTTGSSVIVFEKVYGVWVR